MSEEEEGETAPMDIQIEIMKRLPIKSLTRFMSVSKQWKSVIKSSQFIIEYNGTHIQPPNHFFVGYDSADYAVIYNDDIRVQQILTLPKSDNWRLDYVNLIGYSQGLFGFHMHADRVIVIWNPSINKSVCIPIPRLQFSCCITDFGFTVAGNATEPTIFMITYELEDFDMPCLRVEIFRLSIRAWKTAAPPRESIKGLLNRLRIVVIDRFIYWIAYDMTIFNKLVLSLDLTSEQFTEVGLPPALATSSITFLGLSKLRESLVVVTDNVWKQEIGVWMMEPGVKNSFTKLYNIVKRPEDIGVYGFAKDGQLIFHMCDGLKWKSLLYEPDSKCFKDIAKGTRRPRLSGSYMETLLLIDH